MNEQSEYHLVTGNENKAEEYRSFIPGIRILDVDLEEIQAQTVREILRNKLRQALTYRERNVLVDDTSLYFDCLNGLPGPYVKWFLNAVDLEGLRNITDGFDSTAAEAKTVIGFARDRQEIQFVEGTVQGKIVSPRGPREFQWDPVFQPEGHEKTFAEMTAEEKNEISMRKKAIQKLKKFLT